MKKFHIEMTIAESIIGSLQKCKTLKLTKKHNKYVVRELKTNDSFIVSNINGWECSCGKIKTTGLPCSHILKVMKKFNIEFNTIQNLINKRWILNETNFKSANFIKCDEIPSIKL